MAVQHFLLGALEHFKMILVIILLLAQLMPLIGSVVVLQFNGEPGTRAIFKERLNRDIKLHNLTACSRVKMFSFGGSDGIMAVKTEVSYMVQFRLELWVDKIRPVLADTWRFLKLPEFIKISRWYHICVTYDLDYYRIFLDGEEVANLVSPIYRDIEGTEFNVGMARDTGLSIHADLSQINIWNHVIPDQMIKDMAECKMDHEGNYITWSKGFDLTKATYYGLPLHQFCSRSSGATYMWFPHVTYTQAFYICEALGGHLPMPNIRHLFGTLWRISRERWGEGSYCTANFITFLNDVKSEGHYVREYDGEHYKTNEILWNPDEPNGGQYENCVLMGDGGVFDDQCSGQHCALCEFQQLTVFTLLGTCEREQRNKYFSAYQREEQGSIEFIGYDEYEIQLASNGSGAGQWQWLTRDGTVIASMMAVEYNYPMGRNLWTLSGEQVICGQKSGTRQLLLTSCVTGQFSCNDGGCIDLDLHCDLKYDCKDGSDEADCQIISFPSKYRDTIPPPGENGAPLKIAVNITLESLGVDTSKTQLTATYRLVMTWEDSRLSYRNMKEIDNLNIVAPDAIFKLWTPVVSFVNTETNERSVSDEYASLRVQRRTPMKNWNESAASEEALYPGTGNYLTLARKYASSFVCAFELNYYPFDVQSCPLSFRLYESSSEYMIFDEKSISVGYSGEEYLIEYQVGSTSFQIEDTPVFDNDYSELTVKVVLSRRSGYAILTIYLPSLILLTISYVTLFFRSNIFEVRVMAALTALLVVATLFTQASSSLPKTSYFKTVDIWLLFCIGVIFLIIICHALVDSALYNEEQIQEENLGQQQKTNGGETAILRDNYLETDNLPMFIADVKESAFSYQPKTVTNVKNKGKEEKKLCPMVRLYRKYFTVKFMVKASKVSVFLIVFIFNIVYWITIFLS